MMMKRKISSRDCQEELFLRYLKIQNKSTEKEYFDEKPKREKSSFIDPKKARMKKFFFRKLFVILVREKNRISPQNVNVLVSQL